jgi:hypothetical protein
VGSAGHLVHSGASEARNIDTLFFMIGFHKKHVGTRYVERVLLRPVGSVGHVVLLRGMKRRHVIFHVQVGPAQIP